MQTKETHRLLRQILSAITLSIGVAVPAFGSGPFLTFSNGKLTFEITDSSTQQDARFSFKYSGAVGDYVLVIYDENNNEYPWWDEPLVNIDEIEVIGSASANNIDLSDIGDPNVSWSNGLDGNILVEGEGGDDTLTGSHFDDDFYGGPGGDAITGNAGQDYLLDWDSSDSLVSSNLIVSVKTTGPYNSHTFKGLTDCLNAVDLEGGDIVEVHAGTYNENVMRIVDGTWTSPGDHVNTGDDGGASGAPLVFKSVGGQAVFDGTDSYNSGLFVAGTQHIEFSGITFKRYKHYPAQIWDSQHIDFFNCQFNEATGGGGKERGHGIYVRGHLTEYISFNNCKAIDNWDDSVVTPTYQDHGGDGFAFNPETEDPVTGDNTMRHITMTSCTASGNGRQGVRTKNVDYFDISGGEYHHNGASGIQIENKSNYVDVTNGVSIHHNGQKWPGESGIWFDEATVITLVGCDVYRNPRNVVVTQCEDVTIDGCTIKDAERFLSTVNLPAYGIEVGTGHHHFERDVYETTNSNFSTIDQPGAHYPYVDMPIGGVRYLTVKNCTFSNDLELDDLDVIYGDTEHDGEDIDHMEYSNNDFTDGNSAFTYESRPFTLTLDPPNNIHVQGFGFELEDFAR